MRYQRWKTYDTAVKHLKMTECTYDQRGARLYGFLRFSDGWEDLCWLFCIFCSRFTLGCCNVLVL